MSGEHNPWRDTSKSGGVTGRLPQQERAGLRVAPTYADEFNTIKDRLVPVACWRLDDVRFDFDSSFILPEATDEFAQLASLRAEHPGSPISIFGHADPVGDDEYNKQLSGRRATAVHAVLVRDVGLWENLFNHPQDHWGNRSIQLMLDTLGYEPGRTDGVMDAPSRTAVSNFQRDSGIAATGNPDSTTRARLFRAYMDNRCRDPQGRPFQLTNNDYLARGADAQGKGDRQGCSEFNPILVFSQQEEAAFQAAADKTARNAENAPNRRVVVYFFKPGSRVDPTKWPCPNVLEPTADCRLRFFPDGNQRRSPQALRRHFDVTHDTFACRFFQRIAVLSPCECGQGSPSIATIRFLKSTNAPIPGTESLQVSNFVTNDQLPTTAATTFASTSTDPENFRLEVEDATARGTVRATVEVLRLSVRTAGPFTYQLIQGGAGNNTRWRSIFLRLVTDTDDDAASGNGVAADPDRQTLLVKLGDVVRATFTPASGTAARVELSVGRPRGENNNGVNSLLHDVLEIRTHVVVFQQPGGGGPVRTRAQVQAQLDNANERLAQSCIRLDVVNFDMGGAGDPGVPLPAALVGGFTESNGGLIAALNAQEQAVVALKDSNPNTLDVFYVQTITTLAANTGTSYPAVRNTTGNAAAQNFVVIGNGANPFSLAHEFMHVLLNSPHRLNEPGTSLFRGGTTPNKSVGGTKRIGPYPQAAAAGVGNNDTTTIRNVAENLP